MNHASNRMRSMRRSGSAAPHSNWSPMVKAPTYSGPMASLRTRPTGIVSVPVTATGVRSLMVASRVLGTTLAQGLSAAIMASMSATGTSFLSLKVRAWLWQRMAPTRTQKPSTGMAGALKPSPMPRILLVSAMPFHSSRLTPLPRSLSIQGIRLPPRGTPKLAVSASLRLRCLAMTLRSISRIAHFGVQGAELGEQLTHVLSAAARCGLVGLGGHPFHQACLVQRAHTHQHAADGAVAAHPVVAALGERALDHGQVHRVQDDDGVVLHAQGGGGIDPVAVPAGGAQLGEHFGGVVAALCGDDDVAALEGCDVVGVLQNGFVLGLRGGLATGIRRREENGFDQAEVAFSRHAVDQHRADHAAPTHQTYKITYLHHIALSEK